MRGSEQSTKSVEKRSVAAFEVSDILAREAAAASEKIQMKRRFRSGWNQAIPYTRQTTGPGEYLANAVSAANHLLVASCTSKDPIGAVLSPRSTGTGAALGGAD